MFDIDQSVSDDGEWSEELVAEYCEGLCEAFEESPEGQACGKHLGGLGWVKMFLQLNFNYLGSPPPGMTLGDLNEVLYELIPRKISTDASTAPEIITELRAFWEFLGREYQLPNAPNFVAALDKQAEHRLARELANPRNFGMAKSFFMTGQELGYDMTTEEGLQEFVMFYNGSLAQEPSSPFQSTIDGEGDWEAAPRSIGPPPAPPRTAQERKLRNRERQKKLKAVQRRRAR